MNRIIGQNQSGVVAVNDQLQVGYPQLELSVVFQGSIPHLLTSLDSTPAIVYSGNVNVTVQATTLADRNLGQRILDRLRADPA